MLEALRWDVKEKEKGRQPMPSRYQANMAMRAALTKAKGAIADRRQRLTHYLNDIGATGPDDAAVLKDLAQRSRDLDRDADVVTKSLGDRVALLLDERNATFRPVDDTVVNQKRWPRIEDDTDERAVQLVNEERKRILDRSVRRLDKIERALARGYNSWSMGASVLLAAVLTWLVLYAMLALPHGTLEQSRIASATPAPEPSLAEVAFGYAARVTGTIPVRCLQSGGGDQQAAEDWTAFGTPLAVQALSWAKESKADMPCAWRTTPLVAEGSWVPSLEGLAVHSAAAVSVDVGLIQKLSVFAFFLGWFLVGRAKIDIGLTEGRLRFGRSADIWSDGQGVQLFPRRRIMTSLDRDLMERHPGRVNAELDPNEADSEEFRNLDETYNAYCEDLRGLIGQVKPRSKLRDSLWQQTLAYLLELAQLGQTKQRGTPIADRANLRADSLREDVFRQFSTADFIVWLLPTIGFLGTIYGISDALITARAIFGEGGNQSAFGGVVDSLGTAFDTTAFALLTVAFVMYRKFHVEAALSATADWVATSVREHLVLNVIDDEDGRDCAILERANNLLKDQHLVQSELEDLLLAQGDRSVDASQAELEAQLHTTRDEEER